ncbi:hypothetical protein MRX96_042440 [Rhipicephalus microplus]
MACRSLTIASFNYRGFFRATKQNTVIELGRARKVGILVIQKTYVHRLSQIKSFDATFGTRSYWGFGASGSWDVAIVLMPRFTGTVLRYFKDSDGRLMSMDLDSGIRIRKVHETPELDGDMWDEVKAGAAECFRSWGKRRARKERAEIRIISGVIFLLSRPESTGPGIASTLATLRKELREALR